MASGEMEFEDFQVGEEEKEAEISVKREKDERSEDERAGEKMDERSFSSE